jgi:hypothetical protein
MATRYCGSCGTEVDEDASFCPSCGRAIEPERGGTGNDQTAAIPPAPAWPTPPPAAAAEPTPAPSAGQPAASDDRLREPAPMSPSPAAAEPPPPAGDPPGATPPPGGSGPERPGAAQVELPITWPVTMSGWLIGAGSLVAAVGFLADMFAFRGAGSALSIIFLLLMLGVAATVFLSASVPAIPHLRLATLCLVFVALGVALDRLGFNAAGFGTLLILLGAAAAAAGAVILELGRDRPMSGPVGGGG